MLVRVCVAVVAIMHGASVVSADSQRRVRLEPLPPAVTTSDVKIEPPPSVPDEQKQGDRSKWTEAAIIAAIVVASVAAYKSMGKPCACPYDTDRAGRSCGARSAHSRPGGFKPLCGPGDVSIAIISAFRATGAIPSLR